MKKGKLLVYYDAEKLNAIENYAEKKGVDLLAELDETIGRVYEKCVPSQVREFLGIRQQQETEAKTKAAEKKTETSDSIGGEWQ